MKIYNTSCFEKLKIRSVDIDKLSIANDILVERLDPKKLKIEDLREGYICRTSGQPTEECSNIWIYVNPDTLEHLFDEEFEYGGFVTPDTGSNNGISFLYVEDYLNTWPKPFIDTYIEHVHEFNIIDVWKTSDKFIDEFSLVYNAKQFIDFYQEHKIVEYENI